MLFVFQHSSTCTHSRWAMNRQLDLLFMLVQLAIPFVFRNIFSTWHSVLNIREEWNRSQLQRLCSIAFAGSFDSFFLWQTQWWSWKTGPQLSLVPLGSSQAWISNTDAQLLFTTYCSSVCKQLSSSRFRCKWPLVLVLLQGPPYPLCPHRGGCNVQEHIPRPWQHLPELCGKGRTGLAFRLPCSPRSRAQSTFAKAASVFFPNSLLNTSSTIPKES